MSKKQDTKSDEGTSVGHFTTILGELAFLLEQRSVFPELQTRFDELQEKVHILYTDAVQQFGSSRLEQIPKELQNQAGSHLSNSDLRNLMLVSKSVKESGFARSLQRQHEALQKSLNDIRTGPGETKYDALLAHLIHNRETKSFIKGIATDIQDSRDGRTDKFAKILQIITTAISSKVQPIGKDWTSNDVVAALKLVRELYCNFEEKKEYTLYTGAFRRLRFNAYLPVAWDISGYVQPSGVEIKCFADRIEVCIYSRHGNSVLRIDSEPPSSKSKVPPSSEQKESALMEFSTCSAILSAKFNTFDHLAGAVTEIIALIEGNDDLEVYGHDKWDDVMRGIPFVDGIADVLTESQNPFRIHEDRQRVLFAASFHDTTLQ